MSDTIGTVEMALDGNGNTWEVSCRQCPWNTSDLLATGFDGHLGVENYELVQSLSREHSSEHAKS